MKQSLHSFWSVLYRRSTLEPTRLMSLRRLTQCMASHVGRDWMRPRPKRLWGPRRTCARGSALVRILEMRSNVFLSCLGEAADNGSCEVIELIWTLVSWWRDKSQTIVCLNSIIKHLFVSPAFTCTMQLGYWNLLLT